MTMRIAFAVAMLAGACAGSPYAINRRDQQCRQVLSNPQAPASAVADCRAWFDHERDSDIAANQAAGAAMTASMQAQADGQAARAAVLSRPTPTAATPSPMRCRPASAGLRGEMICEPQ